MIYDGRWKKELKKQARAIAFWRKLSFCGDIAKHHLNRTVLYSATILRKMVEEETEAKAFATKENITLGKIVIINTSLNAVRYPYNGEEGWTFRGKLCAMNYGEGQSVCVKAKDVCNWLLHSYVWGVAFNEDRKGFAGFFVASDFDKEKFVHYISFEEWRRLLILAIENGAI